MNANLIQTIAIPTLRVPTLRALFHAVVTQDTQAMVCLVLISTLVPIFLVVWMPLARISLVDPIPKQEEHVLVPVVVMEILKSHAKL